MTFRRSLLLFVLVIFVAFTHLSFFRSVREYWYNNKSFESKITSIKTSFQKGMVLPLFALEHDYPYIKAIDEIADLGANSISLFLINYQEDIRTETIYLNVRAIEALRLGEMIDYAHRRGLSVFLFPTLHIQHLGHKEWRGVLKPGNRQLWWENYFRVIRFYTMIAREYRVEMLSVGSELCAMESEYDQWSRIIRYCRQNYNGLLTYSANWDHYKNIPFMKDLDFLGMNAYFNLTQSLKPKLPDLVKAWKPARERVEEAYREYRKPLLFTEIGYPSVDGAAKHPWNYFATTPVDLEEQKVCYEAFINTWDPPPAYMHGVYFYNWWGPGGAADRDYTPRGKPAERVLSDWYGRM